jgi:saccharopine dehydrogenase-like NADP-dependent oxidoreductase
MQNILIIGAGRSATYLIEYLLTVAETENWSITLADSVLALAEEKIANCKNATAIALNIENAELRKQLISKSSIVVSMLPAHMHFDVATDCVALGKHLVTASYVSAAMQQLNVAALNNNVLLLNEIGLDPGIDHMSAMRIIHQLKNKGATITSFKSFCGGLVAPESVDNPWGYKFSWNPRNVVLAGQNTAQYLENAKLKFIPYNRLFATAETITVDGLGTFDAYANRDSLSYQHPYELENIETILRGTLRQHPYCKAWNVFVQLGLCDDTYKIDVSELTYKMLVESFLPNSNETIKNKLIKYCGADDESFSLIEFTGILDDVQINIKHGSPAEILQELLERKWKLQPEDKDMIVMVHLFEYEINGEKKQLQSSLIVKGENSKYTAMAKTVGLPAAIAVKHIMQNKISLRGVQIPIMAALYNPILDELESLGISFAEKEIAI